MGSPADTSLSANLRVNFSTTHKRTDLPLSPQESKDNIAFTDINVSLTDGRGKDKANLQYYSRRRLINATEVFNVDNLENNWGFNLNYDAVKVIIIRNRETAVDRNLEVLFKNEHYVIGPEGARVIVEPSAKGVTSLITSASSEEGALTVSSNADITYDLIIIGADKEASTSSG